MTKRCGVMALIVGLTALGGTFRSTEAGEPEAKHSGFKLVRTLKGGVEWRPNFSPNGRFLVSVCSHDPDDGTIRLFDVATGKLIRKTDLKGETLFEAVFVQGGRMLACCGEKYIKNVRNGIVIDQTLQSCVHLLEVPSLVEKAKLASSSEDCVNLAPSLDGNLLAVGTGRSAMLWDLSTGKRCWQIRFPLIKPRVIKPPQPAEYLYPKRIAFAPDGRVLAMIFWDGTARLFDVANGKELCRFVDPEVQEVHRNCLTFSPNGNFLAVGMGCENMLRLWNVTTREPRQGMRWSWQFTNNSDHFYNRGVKSLGFSLDGKTVATACGDDKIRLWEVATGKLRHEAEADGLDFIAFSPNGQYLASSHAAYKRIYLWDWRDPDLPSPHPLTAVEAERCWKDLSTSDAAAAYRAIATLAASPRQAIKLMERLHPVAPVTSADIDRLIKELDDDRFAIRDRSTRQLAELGMMAEARLRTTLSQNQALEVRKRIEDLLHRLKLGPPPEQLRTLRAIEVLEYLGTPEARELLQKLSKGAAGRVETEDAKAALGRLARSGPKKL